MYQSDKRDRINLRLNADTLDAVDASRANRAGKVSRNTWITEAILEKLQNENAANERQKKGRLANE